MNDDAVREKLAALRRQVMADQIVFDDQCPITSRRCDRPCGAECIRGMAAAAPLLAKVRAVEALADDYDRCGDIDLHPSGVAEQIRAALGTEP